MIGCHTSIDIYIKYNVCVVMLQVHYQQYRLLCKQKNISNWQEKNYRNLYIVQLFRHLCFVCFSSYFIRLFYSHNPYLIGPILNFLKSRSISALITHSFFSTYPRLIHIVTCWCMAQLLSVILTKYPAVLFSNS